MKSVRIWFEKDKQSRYISHLDLNRVMLRAVNMAKLPMWYTQGFHPHPFITFALPLSLGMKSLGDSMDIRLTEDVKKDYIIENLNKSLPSGLSVFDVTEPVMKPKEIEYAEFSVSLYCEMMSTNELYSKVNDLFTQKEIFVDKKTKSGVKNIEIKKEIQKIDYKINDEKKVLINIVLPAGSRININPILFLRALEEKSGVLVIYDITREALFNKKFEKFR